MSKGILHDKNEGLKNGPIEILVACCVLNQKGADNKITTSQTMEICTDPTEQHAQTSKDDGPDCMQDRTQYVCKQMISGPHQIGFNNLEHYRHIVAEKANFNLYSQRAH